jgi:hypothetical protein
MTDMWNHTAEMAKRQEASGGNWLRLQNDGDTAVVVFLGDPYPRDVAFVDGKYTLATEELKAKGVKSSLRVAFNVALYPTREVKVFEQGIVFFKDLTKVREKYGLDRWVFEIQRRGAAKDPKTSYTILPDRQLTPDEQRLFAGLQQHDLARLYSDATASASETKSKAADVSPDPAALQALVDGLKALPRDAVERFCSHFGVARIRDIPAYRIDAAKRYVVELTAEFAPAAGGEIDPFAD